MMFRRLCSENVNHSIAFVNGCSFSRRTCFKYVAPLAFFLDIVVSLTKNLDCVSLSGDRGFAVAVAWRAAMSVSWADEDQESRFLPTSSST